MAILQDELDRRWRDMFAALAAGGDVSPGQRLRTEGVMEAAVLTRETSADDLLSAMNDCYLVCFGHSIAADFGDDWQAFYPFPQIPAVGRRAPVYPSTSD